MGDETGVTVCDGTGVGMGNVTRVTAGDETGVGVGDVTGVTVGDGTGVCKREKFCRDKVGLECVGNGSECLDNVDGSGPVYKNKCKYLDRI